MVKRVFKTIFAASLIMALALGMFVILTFALPESFVLSIADRQGPAPVVPDYRACVGIEYDGRISYDWRVSQYGEPNSTEIIKPDETRKVHRVYVSFGYLRFYFTADDLDDTNLWYPVTITTTDPEHCFGKAKIHVGSTREEVIKAYRNVTAPDRYPLGECYVDGDFRMEPMVTFTYDENDIVTSIEFIQHM